MASSGYCRFRSRCKVPVPRSFVAFRTRRLKKHPPHISLTPSPFDVLFGVLICCPSVEAFPFPLAPCLPGLGLRTPFPTPFPSQSTSHPQGASRKRTKPQQNSLCLNKALYQ